MFKKFHGIARLFYNKKFVVILINRMTYVICQYLYTTFAVITKKA